MRVCLCISRKGNFIEMFLITMYDQIFKSVLILIP